MNPTWYNDEVNALHDQYIIDRKANEAVKGTPYTDYPHRTKEQIDPEHPDKGIKVDTNRPQTPDNSDINNPPSKPVHERPLSTLPNGTTPPKEAPGTQQVPASTAPALTAPASTAPAPAAGTQQTPASTAPAAGTQPTDANPPKAPVQPQQPQTDPEEYSDKYDQFIHNVWGTTPGWLQSSPEWSNWVANNGNRKRVAQELYSRSSQFLRFRPEAQALGLTYNNSGYGDGGGGGGIYRSGGYTGGEVRYGGYGGHYHGGGGRRKPRPGYSNARYQKYVDNGGLFGHIFDFLSDKRAKNIQQKMESSKGELDNVKQGLKFARGLD